jgi:hypothetical protein
MRKVIAILSVVAAVTPAFAQPAPTEQTARQKYNYWTRCVAMFQIVAGGQRDNGNVPQSEHWQGQAKLALDNLLKEAAGLNISRADTDKTVVAMTDQFKETLASGDKSTEAQFGRAVEICSSSLMTDVK